MTMRIGNLDISSMSINGRSVDSVWLGNDLVWGGAPSDIMLDYFTLPTTTEHFIVTDGEFDFVPYIDDEVYNGSVITPNIHGYVPDFMTISGSTSATNPGTYYVTFGLPNGYIFKTTGTASVTVSWEIIPVYTVTIITGYYGGLLSNYRSTNVVINGENYRDGNTLYVQVPRDTMITCQTTGSGSTTSIQNSYITYNSTEVARGGNMTYATYSFSISSDVTINGQAGGSSAFNYYGYIDITTS